MEGKSSNIIIGNQELLQRYVSANMQEYFKKKLPNEDPDYVMLKVTELLKYLVLSHNTSGAIPFSYELDEIWHLWILQTKQYQ